LVDGRGVEDREWLASVIEDVGMGGSSEDAVAAGVGVGAASCDDCDSAISACFFWSAAAIRASFASLRVRGRETPVYFAE
jgi:hypothetical protein